MPIIMFSEFMFPLFALPSQFSAFSLFSLYMKENGQGEWQGRLLKLQPLQVETRWQRVSFLFLSQVNNVLQIAKLS